LSRQVLVVVGHGWGCPEAANFMLARLRRPAPEGVCTTGWCVWSPGSGLRRTGPGPERDLQRVRRNEQCRRRDSRPGPI